jgi:hypothetical protein
MFSQCHASLAVMGAMGAIDSSRACGSGSPTSGWLTNDMSPPPPPLKHTQSGEWFCATRQFIVSYHLTFLFLLYRVSRKKMQQL